MLSPGQLTRAAPTGSSILEMGAYFHITPCLQTMLGYNSICSSYLGDAAFPADEKTVLSSDGRIFRAKVDLFNADFDIFPYASQSFSTVLCCELFEHLSLDPVHCLSECNRVLKKGGHLVLTTPNAASFSAVYNTLIGTHPGVYLNYTRPRTNGSFDPKHSREYTPAEIKELLKSCGFEPVLLTTCAYSTRDSEDPSRSEIIRLLKHLGHETMLRDRCIIAVAKKLSDKIEDRYPEWLYD